MMFPSHRYMDPYPQIFPHHRDQNAHPYHIYPSWEGMPPHMKADSIKPFSSFGPWGYNSHTNPDCNGCCSNNYPFGYYSFRPPYPHFQPPPQPYYHGPYPPYPDAHPAYFHFVPPPPHSVDLPQNDRDKARNHCCGCPNHTCHRRDDNSLKIQEQKPEEEEKDSDSTKLIRLPNYPHPVIWLPPNFMSDREANNISESHPGFWFPLDLNSLKGLRQGGEEKKNWHSEEKQGQAPLPIIRMPSYSKPEEAVKDLKEVNPSPKVSEEHLPTLKITPLKLHENDNREDKAGATEDVSGKPAYTKSGAEKEGKIKTIPVKQVEENGEKKLNVPEKLKEKSEDLTGATEKRKDENGAKKSSDKKETSPVRSSRLPPVCLRVDPLPRKKTANGTSQSPSSPTHKEEEENKDHTPTSKDSKKESPKKKEIKIVRVQDQSSNQTKSDGQSSDIVVPNASAKETRNAPGSVEVGRQEDKRVKEGSNVLKVSGSMAAQAVDNNQGEQIRESSATETVQNENLEHKGRRNFSQTDAAVLIQSAYHGFEVRRWHPLEKLRKIARIREQVDDVRKQIHNVETSSKQLDSKQMVVVSETIMNLLLQLDTIQGLHPSVREIRKSVAKELVCLQEKLDSLAGQGSQEQESKKSEKGLSQKTTDSQVPSFTGLSMECETNHVLESAEPSNEKGVVEQLTNEEIAKSEYSVVATEGQSAEPTLGGPVESLVLPRDEIVPPGSEEYEKDSVKGETTFETGILVGSHLTDEERRSGAEDPCKQSVTVGSEPEGAQESFTEVQVPNLGTTELLESVQVTKCDMLHLRGHEVSDSVTGLSQDRKDEPEVEEAAVPPTEEWSNLEAAAKVEATESETSSSTEETIEHSSAKIMSDCETSIPLMQEDTAYTKQEFELPPQMPEESGHDDHKCQTDTVYMTNLYDSSAASESDDAYRNLGEDIGASVMIASKLHHPFLIQDGCNSSEASKDTTKGKCLEETVVKSELEAASNFTADMCVDNGGTKSESEAAGEAIGDQNRDALFVPSASVASVDFEGPALEPLLEANTNEASDARDFDGSAVEYTLEANNNENNPPASTGGAVDHLHDLAPAARTSLGRGWNDKEKKLLEENEKLRKMLERLLEAGKQQLGVIPDLNGRVKDLERKLSQKKKMRVRRHRLARTPPVTKTVSSAA